MVKKTPKKKTTKVVKTTEDIVEATPLKLDLGCGSNKIDPSFTGVDISPDCGADVVLDLSKGNWPFADNSVDEAYCSHFFEHLDGMERITFMNELDRVLKPGAKVTMVTPAPFTHRYMQDPTHKFPMVVQETYNYFNKEIRDAMGLSHYPITANFTWQGVFSHNQEAVAGRNPEYIDFASRYYINTLSDLFITLTKL